MLMFGQPIFNRQDAKRAKKAIEKLASGFSLPLPFSLSAIGVLAVFF
jgi:hypothetical protein